jgi:hypothetical protein
VERPTGFQFPWRFLNPFYLVTLVVSYLVRSVYVTAQFSIVALFAPKSPREPFIPRCNIAVIGAGLTVCAVPSLFWSARR